VVDSDTARWDVPRAQVAELLAANARKVRLHYRDAPDGAELLWGVGSVVTS
jgi:fructose-specific component phosphotransferase system IIB-like protein